MRKLLPLLACLMLVFAGWSAMTHAAEAAGGNLGGVEFIFHAPGDGDEVGADGDNSLPHHHSICHGHDVATPQPAQPQPCYSRDAGLHGEHSTRVLSAADKSTAPRPPQA